MVSFPYIRQDRAYEWTCEGIGCYGVYQDRSARVNLARYVSLIKLFTKNPAHTHSPPGGLLPLAYHSMYVLSQDPLVSAAHDSETSGG